MIAGCSSTGDDIEVLHRIEPDVVDEVAVRDRSDCISIDSELDGSIRICLVVLALVVDVLEADVEAKLNLTTSRIIKSVGDVDRTRRVLSVEPVCRPVITAGSGDVGIAIRTELGVSSFSPTILGIQIDNAKLRSVREVDITVEGLGEEKIALMRLRRRSRDIDVSDRPRTPV